MNDNDRQMLFRDLGSLKLPDICLTGAEKPRKNLTQETCPDRGSNSGPLRNRRACYRLTPSGGRFLYQQVSFSPECWTKMVLQDPAVVGSVYSLPCRYSVVQYYPTCVRRNNEHCHHSTLCRAHFLWMRTTGILPFT